MKRLLLIMNLLVLPAMPSFASDRPVVLAIADIQDIGDVTSHMVKGLSNFGLRNHVVSRLVRDYRCCVLSRSQSSSLMVESKLINLSLLDNPDAFLAPIHAADFVISPLYQFNGKDKEVQGFIEILNLSGKGSAGAEEHYSVPFSASSAYSAADAIVAIIAKELSIGKRVQATGKASSLEQLKYAVLPFRRLDQIGKGDAKNQDGIVSQVELALQDSGLVEDLVDRQSISSVLAELKIKDIEGVNEAASGVIGRILGADRMILGTVAEFDVHKRLDVQLIDAKTALVLEAQFAICETDEVLIKKAKEFSIALVQSSVRLPNLSKPSPVKRTREAQFYLDLNDSYSKLRKQSSVYTIGTLTEQVLFLNNAEAAMFLDSEEAVFSERIISCLEDVSYEVSSRTAGHSTQDYYLAKRAVFLMDQFTSQAIVKLRVPTWLLYKASSHCYIDDYKVAWQCISDYRNSHPEDRSHKFLYCMIDAASKLGFHDEASEALEVYVDEFGDTGRGRRFAVQIAKEKGDEREIFKALKKMLETYPLRYYSMEECKDNVSEFIDLQYKHQTPREILKWLKGLRTLQQTIFKESMMVQEARCYSDLGDKKKALKKARQAKAAVENAMRGGAWGIKHFHGTHYNICKELIDELESEIGSITFKKDNLAAVKPFPQDLKVYVIPVAGADSNVTRAVASSMSGFIGTDCGVLQEVKVPTESYVPSAYGHNYKVFHDNLLLGIAVPDDAAFIVLLTKENLLARGIYWKDYKVSRFVRNPLIHSYRNIMRLPDVDRLGSEIAADINAKYLTECLGLKKRIIYDVSSNYLNEDRRAKYEKVDFYKVHRKLMNYIIEAGGNIVKASEVKAVFVPPPPEPWNLTSRTKTVPSDFLRTDMGEQGLIGEYFSGMNFETQVLTRVDGNIDFKWAKAAAEGLSEDNFSVRWSGKLKPVITGIYRFGTLSDDGVRLWLNGEKIIDNWTNHGGTFDGSKVVKLEAGKEYPIKLEYYESAGGSTIKLYWRREKK